MRVACGRRIVGAAEHNQLLAGALLHQVRKPLLVGPDGRAAKAAPEARVCASRYGRRLAFGCEAGSGGGLASSSSAPGPLPAIGVDPAFARHSSLYRQGLYAPAWFNATHGSPDVNPHGIPYAFHHHPLRGYTGGYPVLLDPRMTAARAGQLVTLLRDGAYLSASQTESLTLELVTFNPQVGQPVRPSVRPSVGQACASCVLTCPPCTSCALCVHACLHAAAAGTPLTTTRCRLRLAAPSTLPTCMYCTPPIIIWYPGGVVITVFAGHGGGASRRP